MKYVIVKKFVTGLMSGMTVTERTSVAFDVGRRYSPCAGNSDYIIVSCDRIK